MKTFKNQQALPFCGFFLLVTLLETCQGYQLPNQPRAAFFAKNQRRGANDCPKLSVGADFDSDYEAALGQAPLSEYEQDAEFYRKRNEAYYKSLDKSDEEEIVTRFSVSDAKVHVKPDAQVHEAGNPRWVTDSINNSIKAGQDSFRYVEKTTFAILYERPVLALAIFAAAGAIVAYLSGFFFLEGYIENWNPVENDIIPYWDDAEIHTIERALPEV